MFVSDQPLLFYHAVASKSSLGSQATISSYDHFFEFLRWSPTRALMLYEVAELTIDRKEDAYMSLQKQTRNRKKYFLIDKNCYNYKEYQLQEID